MEPNKETYSYLQFSPVFIPFYCNPLMCFNLQTQNYPVNPVNENIKQQNSLLFNRNIESQQKISHLITKPTQLMSENHNEKAQLSPLQPNFYFNTKITSATDKKKTQSPKPTARSDAQLSKQKRPNLNQGELILSQIGKSNWTSQQQQKLKQLVNLFGKRWKYISQHFPNRTGKQIRQRYLNYLRPNLSLKRWTDEQDKQIMELILKYGRSWRTIEKKLKNRSQNQIKNRYYGHLQKSEITGRSQKDPAVEFQNKKSELRTEIQFGELNEEMQKIQE